VGVTRTLRRHAIALLHVADAELARGRQDLVELLTTCQSLEDFQQAKLHACALRARAGQVREAIAARIPAGAALDALEHHFHQVD
jgi:hypothetical protein